MRVAVIGAGVVGLATTAHLLGSGVDAACYERGGAAMDERSAGSSRIFRLAHATPGLVRLAQAARAGYDRWGRAGGTPFVAPGGCAISGGDLTGWAAAMQDAGAPCAVVAGGEVPLPAPTAPEQLLLDRSGGVIQVDAVRKHLVALTRAATVREAVDAVERTPTGGSVWSAGGRRDVDAVVLAAGAGTPTLAAQVGIDVPTALAHHVRFTFPAQRSARWPSWIDRPATGMGTYQHRGAAGTWSVGGHVDPARTAWEVGREAATEASREAVLHHVREHLDVEPRIVEELYCTTNPDLGDGFEFTRSGAILAVHGENLFKFAPLLGELLATASVDGSTPEAGH